MTTRLLACPLVLALAHLSGCNASGCPDKPCLPANIVGPTLVSGQYDVTAMGDKRVWGFQVPNGAQTECTIGDVSGFAWNADLDDLRPRLTISCKAVNWEAELAVRFVDPRRLSDFYDNHARTSEEDLRVTLRFPDGSSCYSNVPPIEHTLMVQGVVGGLEPHPAIVSADFQRTLKVVYPISLHDLPAKQWSSSGAGDCSLTVDINLSMTLQLYFGNYQRAGTAACTCE
jgi:hypothetical protein